MHEISIDYIQKLNFMQNNVESDELCKMWRVVVATHASDNRHHATLPNIIAF